MSWKMNSRAHAERDRRHEFNARFDDRRERFASSAPDPDIESAMSEEDNRAAWEAMSQEERDHVSAWLENEDRKKRARIENDEIPF